MRPVATRSRDGSWLDRTLAQLIAPGDPDKTGWP